VVLVVAWVVVVALTEAALLVVVDEVVELLVVDEEGVLEVVVAGLYWIQAQAEKVLNRSSLQADMADGALGLFHESRLGS
jgi:hypothetical protein